MEATITSQATQEQCQGDVGGNLVFPEKNHGTVAFLVDKVKQKLQN